MTVSLEHTDVSPLSRLAAVWPVPTCCLAPDEGCVCPPMERALRGWMRGEAIPPMSPVQRHVCLDEIASVEGLTRADHENDSDADLARATIDAWVDYSRDKGML